MDRDDLSLVFVSLGLAYPERPRFEGDPLPRLYADLTNRYSFENFQYTRDGAHLRHEDQRSLSIHRYGLSIDENQVTQSIDVIKREFADIVSEIRDHLQIPVFWEPQIILRALWPVPESDQEGRDGVALMRRHAVNINDDQLELLGVTDISGITLAVEAVDDRDSHSRHAHVEVGPYLRDTSQLYIELTWSEHRQIETVTIVEQWMQEAYDYFMDQVVAFADSMTH